MKTLFGRRPDGGGGGRSATASAGSMTASRAAGEASPWWRTRGSAVTACKSANDQRSEAGRRWIARTSCTDWSSQPHT
eukprot:11131451-Alexandrium_andersonii.AAC.1